jgi:hypothetical protein
MALPIDKSGSVFLRSRLALIPWRRSCAFAIATLGALISPLEERPVRSTPDQINVISLLAIVTQLLTLQ